MKIFINFVVLAAIASTAFAQVSDGSSWTDGLGTTATVDVVDSGADGGAGNVTVLDATGFTQPLSATMSAGSTAEAPKAESSTAGETNSPEPNEYRVKNGKLQKKNAAGKWVDMRKAKKPKVKAPRRAVTAPGEEGTSTPDPYAPHGL